MKLIDAYGVELWRFKIDSIVTKISTCLNNGPRMGEFEYEPYWICSARVISNASFDEIT